MDAAELARRFALGGAARLSDGPVAAGRQGAVWRLETNEGTWAVKVPSRPPGEARVRRSTAFQEAARAAGVPAPQVRRTREGQVFAVVGGRQARVYEWVDVLAPDPTLDPVLVGEAVAAVHRVTVADPGPPDPWYSDAVGGDRWDGLVRQLREAGAPFAGRFAGVRDELVALDGWVQPPRVLRTCHRDLWAANLRRTAAGGVCVLDWEDSGPADPDQELGCVLFEFARGDRARAWALTDAYRAAGGPARVGRPGHFSMLVAQLGHLADASAAAWLAAAPGSPGRAAAAASVAEVLDDLHTRERLGALLAATCWRADRPPACS